MNDKKQSATVRDSIFWLKTIGIILLIAAIGLIGYMVLDKGNIAEFFADLTGANIWLLIITGVVLLAGITLLVIQSRKTAVADTAQQVPLSAGSGKWKALDLAIAAMCIALSFGLSYIKIWEMPMGGAITAASTLPVILFSYIYGIKKGLVVSLAYAVLQIIQDPQYYTLVQFILDYILGFGVLGLGGLFKKNIVWGVIFANFLRFLCSFISGFVFFGQYAPEGMNPIIYSLVYNGSFMLPDTLICVIVTILPGMQSNIHALMRKHRPAPIVDANKAA